MKANPSLLLPALSGVVAAAGSTVGQLFLFDPETSPSRQQSNSAATIIDPETARLIYAQRLGLSEFHGLGDVDDAVLQQINDFGGRQRQLFGGEDEHRQEQRVFVVVEAVEHATGLVAQLDTLTKVEMQNPPPSADTSLLLHDLAMQAAFLSDSIDSLSEDPDPSLSEILEEGREAAHDTLAQHQGVSLLHIRKLESLYNTQQYTGATTTISHTLSALTSYCEREGFPLTIALMPPSSTAAKKRNDSPYGTYQMPGAAAAGFKQRRLEAPLTESSSAPSPSVKLSPTEDDSAPAQNLADADSPLRGIIPACFASQSACESATRNCTGHGSCSLKYDNKEIDEKVCYACVCDKAEVRENPDGSVKTTHFGGPACQKKNVVMPFWLLAGFTVGLVATVSWGIGLLYSMGNEELPSVIGAGVSGPRAK
ncbi:hypothetical protein BDY21DRAFT_336650 [Lineolata rhizophorae]|uniref:Uncharacterized protein n=1 Tax=Lineolata rhizophorae TaxID=578093 RepID=A0A6A6P7S1_9PEZI|nr:hypothetical protein BDY21DRAFT_336650 [Lineolata rhizophorae]